MSRLVLVSNRVHSLKKAAQAGGAAVAIAGVLNQRGGLWFGWSGQISEELPPSLAVAPHAGNVIATTPLTAQEHAGYYLGYSNSAIWPAFHGRLDLAQFDGEQFRVYRDVNRRLAALIRPHVAADDVIWVHDYHLFPLAEELRALGVTCRIGFFLHIPFPPSQIFMAIPEHAALARAIAAYDVVGVQTEADAVNLRGHLVGEHGARDLGGGMLRVLGRQTVIDHFAVGINADDFAKPATDHASPPTRDCCRLVGVDRLDYTKGLPQKLAAFGRFLEQNPEYRKHAVLNQIAPPTREKVAAYDAIRAELATLAGTINGQYGELDWVPVNCINRPVSRRKLSDIYRSSQLCLVTPLRDGMNLVAKEYVAAQDPADPGCLVLSRFAGAAEDMREALIVNPHDLDQICSAIKEGIEMPLDERRDRHAALLARVRQGDARHWCRTYLARLDAVARPPKAVNAAAAALAFEGLRLARRQPPRSDGDAAVRPGGKHGRPMNPPWRGAQSAAVHAKPARRLS